MLKKVKIHPPILRNIRIFLQGPVSFYTNNRARLPSQTLDSEYKTPEHYLFKEDIFYIRLERVRSKNEARVIRDIILLLIPSAKLLYIYSTSNY